MSETSQSPQHNFGPHTAEVTFVNPIAVPYLKEAIRERNSKISALGERDAALGELAMAQSSLDEANRALEASSIDKKTGLPDETVFWHDFESEAKRLAAETNPENRSIVVLLGDAAGLKRLNDNIGRAAGDTLIEVSGRTLGLIDSKRPSDSFYRLGSASDEYAGILRGVKPDKDGSYATAINSIIAQKERAVDQALRETGLPVDDQRLGIVMVGARFEAGMDPREFFYGPDGLDAQLMDKKRHIKATLPVALQQDERL